MRAPARGRAARRALALAAVATTLALAAAPEAAARELARSGERVFALRTSLKSSVLVTHERGVPDTLAATSAQSLWRLRLEPEWRAGETTRIALAYEQRMRILPAGASPALGGMLPAELPPPYRIRPLDRAIASEPGLEWRHELDRAFVAAALPRADLTLGRQAVGWGRGVVFGAVDLFSPFAPLEVDREWRRGVDAVRADLELTPRLSNEWVVAFGEERDSSAIATRVRGYRGEADGELIAGWRAGDRFAGATASAPVGEAEAHGELAWFGLPEPLPDGRREAWKGVLGGSWRVPLGAGVMTFLEYHYSGFGVARASDLPAAVADPVFATRLLRGDTQIPGRHALALFASAETGPELTWEGLVLVSPTDGSGVVTPGLTLHFGDRVLMIARLQVPFGATASGSAPRSFYGDQPLSGFVQIALAD